MQQTAGTVLTDASFDSEEDGLYPVGHSKLAEQVADVGLHRVLADEEFGTDVLVALALGDQLQDLALPDGQATQTVVWNRLLGLPGSLAFLHLYELGDQLGRHLG